MLQRLITGTGQALIWGEAGGALNHLSDAYYCYQQMLGPGGQRYKHGFGGNGADQFEEFRKAGKEGFNQWIASMNPPADTFTAAFGDFLEAVYARPARELGYANWGIKEVQSGLDAASFLKMLYPAAKFVFLVRHPIACLTSIKRREWLDRPGDPKALEYYGQHWARLAAGFRQAEFGEVFKYEELVDSRSQQARLGDYLGYPELSESFGSLNRADWSSSNEKALGFMEKRRLLRIVQDEMGQYGYE